MPADDLDNQQPRGVVSISMTQAAIPKMFDTCRTIDGWEVIAADNGHAVTKPRSQRSAVGIANKLNRLHASGDRKAFARALGTYD